MRLFDGETKFNETSVSYNSFIKLKCVDFATGYDACAMLNWSGLLKGFFFLPFIAQSVRDIFMQLIRV